MLSKHQEGDDCPNVGCVGKLELNPVEDCACHVAPPCRACIDRYFLCPGCGWESI